MFGQKSREEEALPTPPSFPPDEVSFETREVTAIVIRQAMCRSGSTTYNHIAVLIAATNGEKDTIIQDSRSCEDHDAALCQKGDRVALKIFRPKSGGPWTLQELKIIYDIEKERAAIEAATRQNLAGED